MCGLSHSPVVPPSLSAYKCGTACSTFCHLACSSPPAVALPQVLSAPPTGLGECFFFISLVVGLPYSSIFCQFWLLFVFKLLLSFFWLCEDAQCIYLHLHLGQKSYFLIFLNYILLLMLLQLPPFTQQTPTPSGNPPTIVHVHGSAV